MDAPSQSAFTNLNLTKGDRKKTSLMYYVKQVARPPASALS
ncbi:hypothetical protein [uncultured Nostoc sp.]